MKNSRLCRVAGAAVAVTMSGCATMFTGTTDDVTFEANVPDVRLSIDGEVQGQLPLTVKMSRNFMGGRRFLAKFERDGYATQEFELKREFNTVAILDVSSILTSGGVDVLTGSIMRFAPKQYHVQMVEAGTSATSAEFQRTLELYRFALTNYRDLQKDIARGGGDHLATFAWLISGGDEKAGRLVVEQSVSRAPWLVSARTAHRFVREFDRMLAENATLDRYRLERGDSSSPRAE
jgi:hypothetical protein